MNYNYLFSIFNIVSRKRKLHAVVCDITGRILCMSNYTNTVNRISKFPNTHVWYDIKHAAPKKMNLNKPFNWAYNGISHIFEEKMIETNSEEYDKYYLLSEKSAAIDVLNMSVNAQISIIERNLIDIDEYNDAKLCDLREDKYAANLVNDYTLTRTRVKELTAFRIRYSDIFLNTNNIETLNYMFDECNREMHVYGNF